MSDNVSQESGHINHTFDQSAVIFPTLSVVCPKKLSKGFPNYGWTLRAHSTTTLCGIVVRTLMFIPLRKRLAT